MGYKMQSSEVIGLVKEYYGKVLKTSKDLKTTACTACGAPPLHVRNALRHVPQQVIEKFYGCGNPIPASIQGLTVLDLGCGSGRDCFVASQFVGRNGNVIGIDMTEEQLSTARNNLNEFLSNNPESAPIRFLQGYIEDIIGAGVSVNSVDLCISNCVVNLSPNKKAVLEGVYSVLKEGGEFHFSDIYCDRRLPEGVRSDKLLFGECLAGALYVGDFLSLARSVGFLDPRQLNISPITISDPNLCNVLGSVKFFSITYRLFKLPGLLEDRCEDYGQIAYYKGGMVESSFLYQLDEGHTFEKDRPVLVCGNTASMLEKTWLRQFFRIIGNREIHYGIFRECGKVVSDRNEGKCCE
jgi:arsenite methyltransferase